MYLFMMLQRYPVAVVLVENFHPSKDLECDSTSWPLFCFSSSHLLSLLPAPPVLYFFLIHLTHKPESRSRKPQSFLWAQLLLYASSWNSIWSYCFRPTPPVRAILFLLHLSSLHPRGGLGRTGHWGQALYIFFPKTELFWNQNAHDNSLSGNTMLCWAL